MDADKETDADDYSAKTAMPPLEKIQYDWGSAYEIEHDGTKWRARRLDGLGGWMEADSADNLRTQIFSDYAANPVRQQNAKEPLITASRKPAVLHSQDGNERGHARCAPPGKSAPRWIAANTSGPPSRTATMTSTLTPAQISAWEATGQATKQIAAHLARKILSGTLRAYAGLSANESLAREWDTSERTAIRAKELLAEYGLLRKGNGIYYVT